MDDLHTIADATSIQAVNQAQQELLREFRSHRKWHHRAHRVALWAFTTIGGLVVGVVVWGASQFRDATTAESRRECGMVATQIAEHARAEHSELRAADQRLADKQIELGRELQKVAMHRLEVAREARPK